MQYRIHSTLQVGDRLYHAGEVTELDLTPEQIELRLQEGIIIAVPVVTEQRRSEEVAPPPVEEKKAKKSAPETQSSN